jgi:hypothetical protein
VEFSEILDAGEITLLISHLRFETRSSHLKNVVVDKLLFWESRVVDYILTAFDHW